MSEPAVCPNCKTELRGQFCSTCGQNQKAIDRHFFTLLGETLEDVFTPDSRSVRTLLAVCFRPGFLTREYFSGRKARYIQPVRLYFITSIAFFFIVSILGSAVATVEEDGKPINIAPTGEQHVQITDLDFLTPEQSLKLETRANLQIDKAIKLISEDPDRARDMVVDAAPPVIFCLLPIFAALLKLFYFRTGRFFTEHLVLALHNHSFIFIALLASNLIEALPLTVFSDLLETIVLSWLPLYLLISLKVTFQQGWFITLGKFFLLGFSYGVLFLCTAIVTLIVGVLIL